MSTPARIEHVTELRVRYADTDQMGIVYYAKYFEYFEVARTELLRVAGLPYSEIERKGYALPVQKAEASYFRGAKYDELLRIEVSMPNVVSPKLEISYRVFGEASDQVIVEGSTILVFVDQKSGRPCRPPQFFQQALADYSVA